MLNGPYDQVRLKEHGSELIEVSDNGSGIKPEDYQALTLKYHTSKISGFDDLSVSARMQLLACPELLLARLAQDWSSCSGLAQICFFSNSELL